ncbi:hypothetical protein G1L11_12565, partial [Tenacibaculum finnmarkense]
DHLGTPTSMYNEEGETTWVRSLDSNGKVREGDNSSCPFLFQGQYYDAEIELAYNRFRYYDPEDGRYISQDPIGLLSGEDNFYSYVNDPNEEIDILGLNNISTGAGRDHVKYSGIRNGKPYSGYASAPSKMNLTPEQIVARRYRGQKNKPKDIEVDYHGKNIRGKNTARGLEEMGAGDGFDNAQRPVGDRNPKKDKYRRAAERYLKKKNSYSK